MSEPSVADPTRAAMRVAESVVALVRAEAALSLAHTRAAGGRLAVTLLFGVAAVFSVALAVVVIVFSPVIWAFRPSAAIGTLAIAVGFALAASLMTFRRWRAHRTPESPAVSLEQPHDLGERSPHAVPR